MTFHLSSRVQGRKGRSAAGWCATVPAPPRPPCSGCCCAARWCSSRPPRGLCQERRYDSRRATPPGTSLAADPGLSPAVPARIQAGTRLQALPVPSWQLRCGQGDGAATAELDQPGGRNSTSGDSESLRVPRRTETGRPQGRTSGVSGQPHRDPDRTLPPGPSRSARSAVPVTVRGDLPLISQSRRRDQPKTTLPRPDPGSLNHGACLACAEPTQSVTAAREP
jgi:hypothetical protein